MKVYESNGFSLEKLLEEEKAKCEKIIDGKDFDIENLKLEINSKEAIIAALEELQEK